MMLTNRNDVFIWLEQETGEKLFHVRLLKVAFRDKQEEAIEVCTKLARLLEPHPDIVRSYIQYFHWRLHVIGNMVAILQHNETFADDMADTIVRWSWAAPQLAAGFALTASPTSIARLEGYLTEEYFALYHTTDGAWKTPKTLLSIYAALKLVGSAQAERFEQHPLFAELQAKDRDNCIAIAFHQAEFWKAVPTI